MVEWGLAVLPDFDMSMDCFAVCALAVSTAQDLVEVKELDEMLIPDILLEVDEALVLHELVDHAGCGKKALGTSGAERDLVQVVELDHRSLVVVSVKGEGEGIAGHCVAVKT